jgi:hypothetical protein
MKSGIPGLLLLAVTVAAPCARANERHFTYTYETAVLPVATRELELWTTWRNGRERYYSAFDHRLELEIGLTERLMTAFYLNFGAVSLDTELGQRESSFEYRGVSSEWKYKLTDPVDDVLGLGLYGELTASTSEYEIEAKLLLDKYVGQFLFAANLVAELEWELERGETERELVLAPVAGVSWQFSPSASVGLEIRSHNEIVDGEWEHSALHAGPVVSYRGDGWWVATTFLVQLPAPKPGEDGGSLILDEHERFEVRALLSAGYL